MSRIADLAKEIEAATEAVARAERAVMRHPEFPSALVMVRSFEKLREKLADDFKQELLSQRVNACSYRIEHPKGRRPSIHGVTSAISLFQDTLTTVYHALKNGPRRRANVSQDSINATRLDYAFTFPGSVGFMMTLEDEQELFTESSVSVAMSTTMQLISASSAGRLDELTEVVGLPAIRLAHQWAIENSKNDFGADIKWRVEQETPLSAYVQPVEVKRLSGILSQYIAKERVVLNANLLHINMFDKTFEMMLEDKRIVGTFDNAISASHPASVPKTYTAYLTVATRVAPSENNDGITYFLDRLDDYDPRGQNFLLPKS